MRLSVLPNDPGYDPRAPIGHCVVLLNGKVVDGCVTADEEIGMVTFIDRDERGRLKVVNGEVAYRRDVGEVRIMWSAHVAHLLPRPAVAGRSR